MQKPDGRGGDEPPDVDAEIEQVRQTEVEFGAQDCPDHQRRSQIGLFEDEQRRHRDREQRQPEFLQPLELAAREDRRDGDRERELREFRWLKRKRADRDPALRAERTVPFDQDEHEQQQGDEVERKRIALPQVIVDEREAEHQGDADRREQRLIADFVVLAGRVEDGRGEEAQTGQRHGDAAERQPPVEARMPGTFHAA